MSKELLNGFQMTARMQSSGPAQRPSLTPQQLHERGPNDTLVLHSPYGPTRNTTYGWGSLFKPPMSAVVADHPHIHIGISSLNAVPTVGKSDRSMRSLLVQYRKKFNCLEHCYPYHKVGDAATWQSWADTVKDSNVVKSQRSDATSGQLLLSSSSSSALCSGENPSADVADASAAAPRVRTVAATRFVYTVKANNVLTHVKQLQMQDSAVQELVQTFFHQRCPQLEPFLGPILLQLPPSFAYSKTNAERLTELYNAITKEEVLLQEVTEGALPSPGAPPWCRCSRQRRIRVAVEFRSRTWFRQETFDLLRSFRWALVVAHHHDDPTFSSVVDTGAGFLYVRLHGPLGRNVGDYGPLTMKLWAEEMVHYLYPGTDAEKQQSNDQQAEQREVFVFLNNSDSNVGGTTSSTVDATCLAEHLRQLLLSTQPPSARSAERDSLASKTASKATPEPERAARNVAVNAEPAEMSSALSDNDGSDVDDTASLPAKRPRTSTQSGTSRDDEMIID